MKHFETWKVKLMNVIKTCSKTHHHLSDQIIFMRHWNISLENLNIFITLPLKQGFWKTKTFFKKREHCLIVERTTIENAIFHTKLSCQKPVSRQVEWGVQKWTYHKERSFDTNYLIFLKIQFRYKNLLSYLIRSTNHPNVRIHVFLKRYEFYFGVLF